MSYLKKHRNQFLILLFVCLSYNLYFIFLAPGANTGDLVYLDILLFVLAVFLVSFDIIRHKKKQRRREEFLKSTGLIAEEMGAFENSDIALHDVEILKNELKAQFDTNCNLEDYITRWCHEIKIPLAALLLMSQKIGDQKLRYSMQEQLEKMNQQLGHALLGCKVQSSIFDIQIHPVDLMECVRTSMQNNQFFLLRDRFEMDIRVEDILVYTDKSWLVYVLDQLISNAVKYAQKAPVLSIWTEKEGEDIFLVVEDNGEGIQECDIRRIFEKGYTGSNHHNGRYRSTGMGLYMVSVILKKLGHTIQVESRYGVYTRFRIGFRDDREHFMI
jgi:signal transduction histidine kinase